MVTATVFNMDGAIIGACRVETTLSLSDTTVVDDDVELAVGYIAFAGKKMEVI